MRKIIVIDKKVIVMFESGAYLEREDVTDEILNQIMSAKSDEEIISLLDPNYQEYLDNKPLVDKVDKSKFLTLKGNSVYWEDISPLSIPIELVRAVIKAEESNDETMILTYKNFWTLLSLNPNEECRQNLLWFLNKWGLKLSKCGFFVAYRNVVPYSNTDGEEIFTDAHSGTTRVKIGEMVTIPREQCDTDSSHSCSQGLHCGGAGWLKKNYYGSQGLVVLVNPSDVTAVPYIDDYGKLRTCAYLPIAKADFDKKGDVIPFKVEDGFDCSYVTKVIYEGIMGTDKDSSYKIIIPDLPGLNKESISDKLLDIAMKCITDRQV